MKRHINAIWMTVLAVTSFSVATASAQVVEDFTTNQTIFEQFGAHVEGTTFVFTSEGLDIDVQLAPTRSEAQPLQRSKFSIFRRSLRWT